MFVRVEAFIADISVHHCKEAIRGGEVVLEPLVCGRDEHTIQTTLKFVNIDAYWSKASYRRILSTLRPLQDALVLLSR